MVCLSAECEDGPSTKLVRTWLAFATVITTGMFMMMNFYFHGVKSRRHQRALDKLKPVDAVSVLDEVCSICRDEQDSWRRLPCGHVFHGVCIERWFMQRTICPNCTLDVSVMENL